MKNISRALSAIALLAFIPFASFADGGPGFRFSGENVPLAATTTSSVATLGLAGSVSAPQILVYNSGTTAAVVNCGPTAAVVATAPVSGTLGGALVPPGMVAKIFKGNTKYCAGVMTSGTATLYFSPGIDQ